ncbi:MAG: hypothetical protein IBX55_17165 [Methyloprofundus sp.]|nr:hypothetical protein [Methyloprofundus sp.]MBW6453188.1 hypothetical protein [Methyloprofundus sp.]
MLRKLYEEINRIDERVATIELKLKGISEQNEDCKRLLTILGVGLLTAIALIAAIGDIHFYVKLSSDTQACIFQIKG